MIPSVHPPVYADLIEDMCARVKLLVYQPFNLRFGDSDWRITVTNLNITHGRVRLSISSVGDDRDFIMTTCKPERLKFVIYRAIEQDKSIRGLQIPIEEVFVGVAIEDDYPVYINGVRNGEVIDLVSDDDDDEEEEEEEDNMHDDSDTSTDEPDDAHDEDYNSSATLGTDDTETDDTDDYTDDELY